MPESKLMKETELDSLIIELYSVNAIKVTDVVLKTGHVSPIYIDLRVIVSYPHLMRKVAQAIWAAWYSNCSQVACDVICGVPYTALPVATCISLEQNIPMVVRRKEAKSYGTKKLVEGVFKEGDRVLLIEDVLTSGTSVLETANSLMQCGLNVVGAVVFLDRNQTGIHNLRDQFECHCVLDLAKLTSILHSHGKITEAKKNQITDWLLSNPCGFSSYSINEKCLLARFKQPKLPFDERLQITLKNNPDNINAKLMSIITSKESNLCVSIDVDTSHQLMKIAKQVAPFVCAIKVHVDIVNDFSLQATVEPLRDLANEHNFVIIEDRKFADIGNTVRLQYTSGIFHIDEWADLVTAHAISGPGVVTGLKCEMAKRKERRGILLIAEMSSHANLFTKANVEAAYDLAQEHSDVVSGFICQRQVTTDADVLHFVPGVSLSCNSDSLGQRYITPDSAFANGADVIIVGRGITSSNDIAATAKEYQQRAYELYQQQTQQ